MNDEDIIAFNKIEEKIIDSLSIPIPQLENTISQDFGKTLFEIEKIKLQQENKQLKEKVNQLETNIEEAIEEIKYFELQANHLDDNIYLDKTLTNKLLEILKGSDK